MSVRMWWRRMASVRRAGVGWFERSINRMTWVRPDVRALLLKDTRVFWRDTTQWAQSLVLFGLLGVYIINLRHFSQDLTSRFWVHLVCYLNLGACSLNLATLTTRFVFPQFSLEGVHMTPAAHKLKVTGTILQDHAAKDMVTALPLYAVDDAGKSRFLAFVFADDAKTEFTVTAPASTKQILLDPEETVLRR